MNITEEAKEKLVDGLNMGQRALYDYMRYKYENSLNVDREEIMYIYDNYVRRETKDNYKGIKEETPEKRFSNCMKWFECTIVRLLKRGYFGLTFNKNIISCEDNKKQLEYHDILDCSDKDLYEEPVKEEEELKIPPLFVGLL